MMAAAADHPILADIRQLASGTLASIARTDLGFRNATAGSYRFIDQLQAQFLEHATAEIASGRRFNCWQDAWRAYCELFREITRSNVTTTDGFSQ